MSSRHRTLESSPEAPSLREQRSRTRAPRSGLQVTPGDQVSPGVEPGCSSQQREQVHNLVVFKRIPYIYIINKVVSH